MKKKRTPYIKSKSRGIHEDNGPGYFNPFRSDVFPDKKKKANKKWARKKHIDE